MRNFSSSLNNIVKCNKFRFSIIKYGLVCLMEPNSICEDEQASTRVAPTSDIHLILRKVRILNMWHLEPERKAFGILSLKERHLGRPKLHIQAYKHAHIQPDKHTRYTSCLSVCLSCLSVCVSVCLSVCLSVYIHARISIC